MSLTPPSLKNSYQRRDMGNPVVQIVLLLIILVLFSWFIVKPKYIQSNERRAQLKASRDQLIKIEDDQRELNRLVNELRSSPDDVKLVDEALPLSGRVSRVYVLLERMVLSSGMNLSLISADNTNSIVSAGDKEVLQSPYEPGRTLNTTTITAQITGNMEQFKNLLQLIETNGRVLDVESVDIVGGEDDTKFRITVKAYAYENI